MHRGLIPFFLACFGFALIYLSTSKPLFEWEVSEVVTDFPSTYEVVISPSPWIAYIGDSLQDGLFIFDEVSVKKEGEGCLNNNFNFMVRFSPREEIWDQIWFNISKKISLLSGWAWLEIFLSAIYIFWFSIWYKQIKVFSAFLITGVALWLFGNLTQILRIVAPFHFSQYFGIVDCSPGSVIFNAKLLRVHYETQLILLSAILAELGALGIMLNQIIKAVIERKTSIISEAFH